MVLSSPEWQWHCGLVSPDDDGCLSILLMQSNGDAVMV